MAIIHNGFIDRKYHDSFKDTGLNDTDIATTKMYKGVKPMWQQLGFKSQNIDNPDNPYWWNNIIPSYYTFENVAGISYNDVLVNDSPEEGDGIGIIEGTKTPRTSYTEIIINENTPQNWQGLNSFNNTYYYPALPVLDKYGVFTNITASLHFGSRTSWDDNDDSAPITNVNEVDDNLILNIDFDQTITDDLIDKTNLSKLNYIQDFEVSLDNDLRLKTDTLIIPDSIEKNNSEQAF